MRRIVVFGIGSRIMKDDGVAVKVVEYLKERIQKDDIQVIIGETDVSFCTSVVRESDLLIIIDAVKSGQKPGTITVSPLNEALAYWSKPYAQHEMSLFHFIIMKYQNLSGYMIGIEPAEISFGLELSEALKLTFSRICKQVEQIIMEIVIQNT